mmetsp:Transcript_54267/g.168309  ORF Transcript_54267/g.168309 Transcript_54267/m.168309 type:complete len:715 (+) Transcript_54267:59-2203(+)
MAFVGGHLRVLLAAAALFLAGVLPAPVTAQLFDPQVLDFHYPSDTPVELTADVIQGNIALEAKVQTQKLNQLGDYLGATLASVCPTLVKVIVRMYQDIQSFQSASIHLRTLYWLLPSNRDSSQCKTGLTDPAGFKQLLAWRINSDGTNGPGWDAMSWTLTFTPAAIVRRRTVRYPDRLPIPLLSTTPPGPLDPYPNQGLIDPGFNSGPNNGTGINDPNCRYAASACVCATTTSCAWLPYQGSSRCIGLGGPPTSISCQDCGVQDQCSRSQSQACDLSREPCPCAESPHQCRWDLSTMSCIPKNGMPTPCTVCSRQAHCDSPQIQTVSPAQNSVFGVSASREITITFDRRVSMQMVMDPVTFQCVGDQQLTTVTQDLLSVQDKVFTIRVASFPRAAQASCELALGEGVVRDQAGLNFRGTAANWYAFRLQDTIAPLLVDFAPANGAENIDLSNAAVTLVFNEPVQLTSSCVVSLSERSIALATFQLNSAAVSLDADRKRLTVALGDTLTYSKTYSVTLPRDCARDDTGNPYLGLSEGVYIFHTQSETYNKPVEEDSMNLIIGIAIGSAAGAVLLVSALVLWCRMRGAKSEFATRLQESATMARRWSAASLDGLWTEFSKPRRFSFDAFAMSGWGGGKSQTAEPPRPESDHRKVHPDPTLVTAQGPGVPRSPSRPGTSEGAPQPSTLRTHAFQGPRVAADTNYAPRPPLARPPTLM